MAKKLKQAPDEEPIETPSEPILVAEEIPLNDDELVIQGAQDQQVELTESFAVFQQEEGMLAWSLQNFFNEDGTIRSKKDLRTDPAILRVEGSGGESVDFALTKEFTKSLSEALETVRLASYGIQKNKKPLTSFKEALVSSILESPLRAIMLGVLVILSVIFIFIL